MCTSGSTFPNIDSKTLKSIKLPEVDDKIQDKMIQDLKSMDFTNDVCAVKIASSKALQKSLINQIF